MLVHSSGSNNDRSFLVFAVGRAVLSSLRVAPAAGVYIQLMTSNGLLVFAGLQPVLLVGCKISIHIYCILIWIGYLLRHVI